jgi:hypothetical protein
MLNAEFRMQNAECRMQNAECRSREGEAPPFCIVGSAFCPAEVLLAGHSVSGASHGPGASDPASHSAF